MRGNARCTDRRFPGRAGEGAAISLEISEGVSAAPAGGLDSAGRQTPEHGGGQSRLKLWLTWLDTLFGSWAPKGLYTRALIIIIAPIVILQSILTFVFLDRHWQVVTGRLSVVTAQEIAMLAAAYDGARDKGPAETGRLSEMARDHLGLAVRFVPGEELPIARSKPFFALPGPALVGGDSRPHPQALLDRHGGIVRAYRDQDQA